MLCVPEDDCYFTTSKDTRTKNCMRDVKTAVIIACIENNFIVLNTMIITKYPNQLKVLAPNYRALSLHNITIVQLGLHTKCITMGDLEFLMNGKQFF